VPGTVGLFSTLKACVRQRGDEVIMLIAIFVVIAVPMLFLYSAGVYEKSKGRNIF
jgi:hypothetical protein